MFTLQWLPANAAWAFIFGKSLVPINDKLLFASKEEAKEEIRSKGLYVHSDGIVRPIVD